MNKKSLKSKLSFNKETLRTLSAESMARVQGGGQLHDMQAETWENACGNTTNATVCTTATDACKTC